MATANPAAERMLGMAEEEMVPRTIASLLSDDGGLGGDVAQGPLGAAPAHASAT